MKSKDEIKELAEKKYPYNPYDNEFFPHTRTLSISGYIKGYQDCQNDFKTELLKAWEAGNTGQSFEDFLNIK